MNQSERVKMWYWKNKFSKIDFVALGKLYESGCSLSDLARKYNLDRRTLKKFLYRCGFEMRSFKDSVRFSVLKRKGAAQKKFKSFDDVEMALSMYYSEASYIEIANYFGYKWTVIADLNESYVEKFERQEAFKKRRSDIGLKGVAGFKKKLLEDPIFAKRISDRISGENNICKLPGVKEKILADWKKNKNTRVSAILKERFKKKTSFEQIVENVIIKNKLPYFYCGNGSVVIGGKCPDFIHKNRKVVVEVFNNIHHKIAYGDILAYRKARILHFREFDYDVIFIPEQIIFDENKILEALGEQQENQG